MPSKKTLLWIGILLAVGGGAVLAYSGGGTMGTGLALAGVGLVIWSLMGSGG